MCAHRTPLGPLPPTPSAQDDDLEQVALPRTVGDTLRRHLFPRRTPQLGLLFGHTQGDTLTLAVAMRAAWPTPGPADPFALDERILLGASEALGFLSRGRLAWCGVWYMHADAQLGPSDRDARLVRHATRLGLCDDRRILLVVGRQEGALGMRAALGSGSSEVVELPINHLGG